MREKGFTLVELLLVISILGLLAMITIPRLEGFRDRGVETATMAELQAVRQAWNYYEIEFGENSLGETEELGVFLGNDLEGTVYLGRYELELENDSEEAKIVATVKKEAEDEEKQRSGANIYIDRIEIEDKAG